MPNKSEECGRGARSFFTYNTVMLQISVFAAKLKALADKI